MTLITQNMFSGCKQSIFIIVTVLIEVLAVKNDCMHDLDTTWIPFLIKMLQFCLIVKGYVH